MLKTGCWVFFFICFFILNISLSSAGEIIAEPTGNEQHLQSPAQPSPETYLADIMKLYRAGELSTCVEKSDDLLKLYPDNATSYEAQMIAAQCHVKLKQPQEVIACYWRIVNNPSDKGMAVSAARTLLTLYEISNRAREGVHAAHTLREHFSDKDFSMFSLQYELKWLNVRCKAGVIRKIKLLKEIEALAPASPEGIWATATLNDILQEHHLKK